MMPLLFLTVEVLPFKSVVSLNLLSYVCINALFNYLMHDNNTEDLHYLQIQ